MESLSVQLTLIFTQTFDNSWQALGLWKSDQDDLIAYMLNYDKHRPINSNGRRFSWVIVPNTGGAYKLRYARKTSNAGKSGSYRLIYFITSESELFFVDVYQKGIQEILSDKDKKVLRNISRQIHRK